MTATNPDDELAYHLRELRADLGLVRNDLGRAETDPGLRALVGAEALLEHDLEVHVPRALALLGAAAPPAGSEMPAEGESEAVTARTRARDHVAAALAALAALEDETLPVTDRLLAAADAIESARGILAQATGTLDA